MENKYITPASDPGMDKIKIAKAILSSKDEIPADIRSWASGIVDSQLDLSWKPADARQMSEAEYAERIKTLAQYYGLASLDWDSLGKLSPSGHASTHTRELALAHLRLHRQEPNENHANNAKARLIPLSESEVLSLANEPGRTHRIAKLSGMTGAKVDDCIKTVEHIFLAEGRGPVRREYLPKSWGIK